MTPGGCDGFLLLLLVGFVSFPSLQGQLTAHRSGSSAEGGGGGGGEEGAVAVVVVVAIPALSAVPSWAAAPHGTPWHPTALHASPAPSTTQNPSVLSLLLFPWQWGFGGGGGLGQCCTHSRPSARPFTNQRGRGAAGAAPHRPSHPTAPGAAAGGGGEHIHRGALRAVQRWGLSGHWGAGGAAGARAEQVMDGALTPLLWVLLGPQRGLGWDGGRGGGGCVVLG